MDNTNNQDNTIQILDDLIEQGGTSERLEKVLLPCYMEIMAGSPEVFPDAFSQWGSKDVILRGMSAIGKSYAQNVPREVVIFNIIKERFLFKEYKKKKPKTGEKFDREYPLAKLMCDAYLHDDIIRPRLIKDLAIIMSGCKGKDDIHLDVWNKILELRSMEVDLHIQRVASKIVSEMSLFTEQGYYDMPTMPALHGKKTEFTPALALGDNFYRIRAAILIGYGLSENEYVGQYPPSNEKKSKTVMLNITGEISLNDVEGLQDTGIEEDRDDMGE